MKVVAIVRTHTVVAEAEQQLARFVLQCALAWSLEYNYSGEFLGYVLKSSIESTMYDDEWRMVHFHMNVEVEYLIIANQLSEINEDN
jgi:hypothetical protein